MEHAVKFNYNARYCKLGALDGNYGEVWFVLHGYGQLAPFFIKKFQFLVEQGHCVIAPEGLNRFYLQGFDGRVGATWMTREDRLRDIDNYLNYLNSVYHKEIPPDSSIKINLLGFSQGVATLSRWVAQSTISFQRYILWAGLLPSDINVETAQSRFAGKTIYMVYGNRDPFITQDGLVEQQALAEKLNLTPRVMTFDGDHDIDETTLARIIAKPEVVNLSMVTATYPLENVYYEGLSSSFKIKV